MQSYHEELDADLDHNDAGFNHETTRFGVLMNEGAVISLKKPRNPRYSRPARDGLGHGMGNYFFRTSLRQALIDDARDQTQNMILVKTSFSAPHARGDNLCVRLFPQSYSGDN